MSLDATVGGTTANSYVTLAEATTYYTDRAHSSAWEDFEDKSDVLVTASLMLDWYMPWKGSKTDSTQSMEWPRSDVLLRDGTEVAVDTIPSYIKTAVFELALFSLASDRAGDNALAGIEQIKAGSLSIKSSQGGANSPTAKDVIPEHVRKICSQLVTGLTFGVVRLSRG